MEAKEKLPQLQSHLILRQIAQQQQQQHKSFSSFGRKSPNRDHCLAFRRQLGGKQVIEFSLIETKLNY